MNMQTFKAIEIIRKRTKAKDMRLLTVLKNNNGSTVTDLKNNTVFEYTYLRNALRRLEEQNKIYSIPEIVKNKFRYRWYVK